MHSESSDALFDMKTLNNNQILIHIRQSIIDS